jgi:DNA-binding MarR family transcriptional regulator
MPSRALSKKEFEDLSDFRYALRRFLRFSEDSATAEGLTPLQYQLLLQIKGERRRDWALVGELAERLQMHQHGAVALVSRCERAGLVRRVRNRDDRRRVQIHLTADGDRAVRRIAARNRPELTSLTRMLDLRSAAFDPTNAPSRTRRRSGIASN